MKNVVNYSSNGWAWQIKIVTILLLAGVVLGAVFLILSMPVLQLTNEIIPAYSLTSDDRASKSPAEELNHTGSGFRVEGVLPGSPAEDILYAGDVIVAFGNQPVDNPDDLVQLIAAYSPGQNVVVRVKRPGEGIRDFTLTLTEDYREQGKAFLGVRYQMPSPVGVSGNPGGESSTAVQLVSRVITREELTGLASFDILWPQALPEAYQLSAIMEMSERSDGSSGSGIFILEYVNVNDLEKPPDEQGRLFLWQYAKTRQALPDVSDKTVVGRLALGDGREIPVFESEEGTALRAFLEQGAVNIELSFYNVPARDVERLISSLAPD